MSLNVSNSINICPKVQSKRVIQEEKLTSQQDKHFNISNIKLKGAMFILIGLSMVKKPLRYFYLKDKLY